MEIVLYLFILIFILLLIGLVYTLVKDFKEIILGLVNMCEPQLLRPITWIISPIWFIGYGLEKSFGWKIIEKYNYKDSNGFEKLPSNKNLNFDFSLGMKMIVAETSERKAKLLIKEFLEFCDGDLKYENFKIENGKEIKIYCPNKISFYDFCILTQHFCDRTKKSWGLFKSDRLNYYSYSHDKTGHNIIGQTSDGQKFSIYTLDDLYENQFLRLNQDLVVKKFEWNKINNGVQQEAIPQC